MTRQELSTEAYAALLESIMPIILRNGLKASTMDLVASTLSMSKRTLYEIFDSKQNMIEQVLEFQFKRSEKSYSRIFAESSDVMTALLGIFSMQRDAMSETSPDFFRDMDTLKEIRCVYEDKDKSRNRHLMQVFELGVRQGVFRPDVNYPVMMMMMKVQLESVKRMEELFPPDITLQQVYDTISIGFLRSIASPEGMKLLDSKTSGDEWKTLLYQEFDFSHDSDSTEDATAQDTAE